MGEFNGFLMPHDYCRRWHYDELIPSLLYFDRVTFLMDDIEPVYVVEPRRESGRDPHPTLRPPVELVGMRSDELVDGLTVEQHRYYWPLRELMQEGVVAITAADLHMYRSVAPALRAMTASGDKVALEYVEAASAYYDAVTLGAGGAASRLGAPPESGLGKAEAVYSWISHALVRAATPARQGWQWVTLHPHGYVALLSALALFPELCHLERRGQVDASGKVRPLEDTPYLAMRVIAQLLEAELSTYVLASDPGALAEVLRIRERYRDELGEFRATMTEAAVKFLRNARGEPRSVIAQASEYVEMLRPVFDRTNRALSDHFRAPRLVLRQGGSLIATGLLAGLGGAAGALLGPEVATMGSVVLGGAVSAVIAGAATKSIEQAFQRLGEKTADQVASVRTAPAEASLVYLFHARKAIQR